MFIGSMLVLGLWIQGRIETDWRESAIASRARLVDELVGDHVGDLLSRPDQRAAAAAARLTAEIEGNLKKEVGALTVWSRDGLQIYATRPATRTETLPADVRTAVLFGDTVTRQLRVGPHLDYGALMRLFVPVRDPASRAIVAVAGADHWSGEMDRLARAESLRTWPMVGLVAVMALALLYVLVTRAAGTIERQQAALLHQARRAQLLSRRSAVLTRMAEQARHDAMVAIERTLARVGSDIHDGPIQRLAILALQLGREEEALVQGTELNAVVMELRSISAGLVLPELDGKNLEEAIRLAVLGHERMTGTKVALTFSGMLPAHVRKAVKVSAFRIIQEGLSNGYRHGGGLRQAVHVEPSRGYLVLTISDCGPGLAGAAAPGKTHLASIRSRVEAMRGELRLSAVEPHGVRLVVSLPVGLRPPRSREPAEG